MCPQTAVEGLQEIDVSTDRYEGLQEIDVSTDRYEGLQEIDVSTDRSGRVTGDRCVHGPL